MAITFLQRRSYNIPSVGDMEEAACLLGICQGKVSTSPDSNYRIESPCFQPLTSAPLLLYLVSQVHFPQVEFLQEIHGTSSALDWRVVEEGAGGPSPGVPPLRVDPLSCSGLQHMPISLAPVPGQHPALHMVTPRVSPVTTLSLCSCLFSVIWVNTSWILLLHYL